MVKYYEMTMSVSNERLRREAENRFSPKATSTKYSFSEAINKCSAVRIVAISKTLFSCNFPPHNGHNLQRCKVENFQAPNRRGQREGIPQSTLYS